MRWQQTELIFKGIYLGMLLFVGLALRERDWWKGIAQVAVCTFGTLALCLGVTAIRKLREGYRIRGRIGAFVLFLVLENPGMVYAGVLLGMLLGTYSLMGGYSWFGAAAERDEDVERYRLLYCVLGGAALGILFNVLYHVESRKVRFWIGLALGAALIAGGIFALPEIMPTEDGRVMFATLLLLGLIPFYLLALASMTEESEVEIMAMCAALGVALWILAIAWYPQSDTLRFVILLVPPTIYYIYAFRILPGLRVFKHVLRGISYANVGQIRPALVSLGRALQLDPSNKLARQQLWNVHRMMDFTVVAQDPATLALIDFELCLERVATLMLAGKPTPEHLQEANRLLNLTASQRPDMAPRCDYWRAVALIHDKNYADAATALQWVLLGEGVEPGNPHRRAILFAAWQLAVMLHPEMANRVGNPQLAIPGRRMSAIATVERQLVDNPEDAAAWDLKRVLYADLTEAEYLTHVVQGKPPERFDHGYAHQLGLALLADPQRLQRGAEFLGIAAIGLPAQAPTIYLAIANAHEKTGNFAGVWAAYESIKQLGQAIGPKSLTAEDRQAYFAVLKVLGEDAAKRGDIAAAIDSYRLFVEYDRAGANTHRILADLYERHGDAWSALHATEQGLVYDATDQDFLARKDRYYYSVQPQELHARLEQVRKWFDVSYCKEKSRWLLDRQGENLDLLDWASHLAHLAQVIEPNSMVVRVLRARVLRRRGEIDQSVAILEEVHGNKPEKFPSSEDEEAWYLSCRLLGDLYLNTKPDQAVLCYQDYRKHGKSGADTVYKMGVAYENLGDIPRARKCYETVAAYEEHPLAPEAHSALSRLQATPQ